MKQNLKSKIYNILNNMDRLYKLKIYSKISKNFKNNIILDKMNI